MSAPARPSPWRPPEPLPAEFRTARLILRPWQPTDAPALFAAIDSSRESLLPWLPWAADTHLAPRQTLEWIEHTARASADALRPEHSAMTGFVLGIIDAATGEPVGGTGFNRMNADTHNAETGYWVRGDRRRRGICAEATAGVLSWGFLPQSRGGWGFRRIHIFAAVENAASCGVPRKLGLRQEMHARQDRWVNGRGYLDTLGWGVLAEEWDCEAMRLRGP